MFFPKRPEQPTAEEVTTYRIAMRYQALESLYQIYQRCLHGQRLAADYGTTIEELYAHARRYRLNQVRNHLEHIERCQNGRTTQELLEQIDGYMREFTITYDEVDFSEAEFNDLRAHARPTPTPLVALRARVVELLPYSDQRLRPR